MTSFETERGTRYLVCTRGLELGVDIGGLDSVLIHSPPLLVNYSA